MAAQQPIATVTDIQGRVFAQNADGELRQLQPGDKLYSGETLVPSEGGQAELTLADGTPLLFDQQVQTTLTPELLANQAPAADESEVKADTVEALLAAIERGEDLNETMEATAAGLAGGNSSGEGSSFVRLARIAEEVPSGDPVAAGETDLSAPVLVSDSVAIVEAEPEQTTSLESPTPEPTPDPEPAPEPVSITATLSASGEVSEDQGQITYTVNLSQATDQQLTVVLANGETITVAVGSDNGSTTVEVNRDDVFMEQDNISNSISQIQTSDNTTVSFSNQSVAFDPQLQATSVVTDDSDTVTASLTATGSVSEGGGQISYTVSLAGGPGNIAPTSDLVFELANGQSITIEAGNTSGSITLPVSAAADDVYLGGGSLTTQLTGSVTGGAQYENLNVNTDIVNTTLTDDGDVTTVTLEAPAPVDETATSLTFTAKVDNAPQGDLTLSIDVDGTAYSVTIPDGQLSATFEVPVREDDALVQGTETVTATVTAVDGTANGNYEAIDYSSATASTTVSDDVDPQTGTGGDTTTVSIEAPTGVDTSENATSLTFTAKVDNAPGEDLVLTVDVNGTEQQVTILANTTSATFDVPVRSDDAYLQGSADITASVTAVSGGNYESLDWAGASDSVSITDDSDVTTVTLEAPAPVDETATSLTFTAKVDNAPQGDLTLSIDVDGTAYSVTIPDGQLSATFEVPVREDDALVQGTETVTATVTAVDGTANGNYEAIDYSSATASTTVSDDVDPQTGTGGDTTTVSIEAPTGVDTSENATSLTFTAKVDNAPGEDLVLTVDVNGTEQQVTILANTTSATFDVPVRSDDAYLQGSADITASVTAVSGGNYESLDWAGASDSVSITDDSDVTTVTLEAPAPVDETATSLTFTAKVDNAPQGDLTLSIDVDGTAYSVTIPDGQLSATFEVPVREDDALVQGTETVTATVTAVDGTANGNYEAIDYSSATASTTVSDDVDPQTGTGGDTTTVSIEAPTGVDTSENATSLTFTAKVDNAPGEDLVLTVDVNGTEQQVTILANTTSATFDVPVRSDDAYLQGSADITASVTAVSGGNYESLDWAGASDSVSITDDSDVTTVTLEAPAPVDETATSLTFTAKVDNAPQGDLTLSIDVDGTAYSVTIPDGQLSATFEVPVREDDALVQGTETVTATVTAVDGTANGNYEAIDYSSATASTTVSDDVDPQTGTGGDTTTVSIEAPTGVDTSENATSLTFTAKVDNAPGEDLVLTVDVNGTEQQVTILANTTSATFDVPVRSDDAYLQGSADITASVTAVSGGNYESLDWAGASDSVSITDDSDVTTVTLEAPAPVDETATSLTFTAKVDNAPQGDLTLSIDVDGTAYSVTIPDGQLSATFEVPVREDDALVQGTETVTATVTAVDGTANGNYEAIDYSSATASTTVSDDVDPQTGTGGDTTTVSIEAPTGVDTSENATSLTFTAKVDNAPGEDLVLTVDVNGTEQQVTILANTTSATFDVPVRSDDAYLQGSADITASVTAVSGGNYESLDWAGASDSVSITDDSDVTTVTLEAPAPVDETATSLTFTAKVDNAPQGDLTLSIDVDGTAYSVTIPDGQLSATFEVPVREDDALVQGTETVTATVTAVDGTANGNYEAIDYSSATASTTVSDDVDPQTGTGGDTTTVSIEAPTGVDTSENATSLTFTAKVDNAPGEDLVLTVDVNGTEQQVTILANTTSATFDVPVRSDDAYLQGSADITASVTAVSGGNYESLDWAGASDSVSITDDSDVTTVTLEAPAPVDETATSLTFTAKVDNAPQGDLTLSIDVDGTAYSVTIPDGQLSATFEVPVREDDALVQGTETVTATVTAVDGTANGNYEAIDYSSATASTTVSDDVDPQTGTGGDTTTVSIEAPTGVDTSENATSLTFTAKVDNAPGEDLVLTVDVNGTEQQVTILANTTSATFDVPVRSDDAYLQGSADITASVTAVSGGNYESLDWAGASDSVSITDDSDVTTVTLEAPAPVDETATSLTFTAKVDNAPQGDLTLSIDVDGTAYSVTIPDGQLSATFEVPVREDDALVQGTETVTATVTAVDGTANGNYEAIDYSSATASTTVSDDVDPQTGTGGDTTTVSIEAPTGVDTSENATSLTFTAKVDNAPGEDLVLTVDVNGTEQQVTILANTTSATFDVPVRSDDAYLQGSADITASVTAVSGGNYESLDWAGASDSVSITDDSDVTTVTLDDATGVENGSVTYTASVDNAPQTAFSVTLSNGAVIQFAAGELTGSSGPVAAVDGTHTLTITGSSGGNYEALDLTDTLVVSTPDSEPTINATDSSVDETGGLSSTTESLSANFGKDSGTIALAAVGATWIANTNTLAADNGDWQIVVNSDGTYTVTQLQAMSHSDTNDPDDAINVTVTATATDNENDQASTNFTVSFLDDGPSIEAPNTVIMSNSVGNSVTDSLVLSTGTDAANATVSLSGSHDGTHWLRDDGQAFVTSEGHKLLYRENADNSLDAYYLDENNAEQLIFQITYNNDGSYTVQQTGVIDGGAVFTNLGFNNVTGGGNNTGTANFADDTLGDAGSIVVRATALNGHTVNYNNNALGVSTGSKIDTPTEVLVLSFYDGENVTDPTQANVIMASSVVTLNFWHLDAGETPVVEFYKDGVLVADSAGFPPTISGASYTYDIGSLEFDSLHVTALDSTGNGFGVASATFVDVTDGIDQSLTLTATVTDGDGDQTSTSWGVTFDGSRADGLDGTAGDDTLVGNEFKDLVLGGAGDDTLTGGLGIDTFAWNLGDEGTAGSPAVDTITDFNTTEDILDLRDLLQGETDATLTSYLNFELEGSDTVIHVSSEGNFTNGVYDSTAEDQTIILSGVDLVTGTENQADIIANLASQLLTDS